MGHGAWGSVVIRYKLFVIWRSVAMSCLAAFYDFYDFNDFNDLPFTPHRLPFTF